MPAAAHIAKTPTTPVANTAGKGLAAHSIPVPKSLVSGTDDLASAPRQSIAASESPRNGQITAHKHRVNHIAAEESKQSPSWGFSNIAILPIESRSNDSPTRTSPHVNTSSKGIAESENDLFEREANQMADRVMSASLDVNNTTSRSPEPNSKHTSPVGAGHTEISPIVRDALNSHGQPMDPGTRSFMESRFQRDFGHVRIHNDMQAARSASAINARAYTLGKDVVFADRQFATGTNEGKHLLAHELVHVMQQTSTKESSMGNISTTHLGIQRSPGDEKSNDGNKRVSIFEGNSDQATFITEDQFRQDYVDNNIVHSTGIAAPGTTWENIDHDRVPQMKLTYKDGRVLILNVADIPLISSFRHIRKGDVGVFRADLRYQRGAGGFIYPMRGQISRFVSYPDADNITSLRAGLHDEIEEFKLGFSLIKAGASFAQNIAALGGFAALTHSTASGGLFEPVSNKTETADAPKVGSRRVTPRNTPAAKSRTIETGETDPISKPTTQREDEESAAQQTAVLKGDESSTESTQGKGAQKPTTQREDEESQAQKTTKVSNREDESKKKTARKDSENEETVSPAPRKKGGVSVEDQQKIQQLKEWDKKQKVTGDVAGLQARLASKDPEVARAARAEFEEIKEQLANGEKPHIDEFADDLRTELPKRQWISDAAKRELERSGWLKQRVPSEKNRRKFMKWLERGHGQGEPHIHVIPGTANAEKLLTQWSQEEGIQLK